jgi:ribonuclease HI
MNQPKVDGAKRRKLGLLLKAAAQSIHLRKIAEAAGMNIGEARSILNENAESLLPEFDSKQIKKTKPRKIVNDDTGKMILFTDGGSRGNPGPGGAGAYLTTADAVMVGAYKKYLGHVTNNEAEYMALILGLDEAAKAGAQDLEVRMDSELVVRQLTGVYKTRHPALIDLGRMVRFKEQHFKRVSYQHIRREKNTVADKLANEAMDEH